MAPETARNDRKVLISGAGIAGLTLGILLKEQGWQPVLAERDPQVRTQGYMMDFFGTGWDVAERMGLTDELRAVRYPIERMEFVDRDGEAYLSVPISRVRDALGDRYVYLRRSDLEHFLCKRAQRVGLEIRFGLTIAALAEKDAGVAVTFSSGAAERFSLVFGADGVHSRIRQLTFGEEADFSCYLGGYVAAFHIPQSHLDLDCAFKLHEEVDRVAGFYPLGGSVVDATFVFRHPNVGHVEAENRLPLLKERMAGPGWIAKQVLEEVPSSLPVYFDSLTQIRMPQWSRGRVALLGDASGCLTLLAGQGSHMAMAGAFVLASELRCHRGDHSAAFGAYEKVLKGPVLRKQRQAERFAKILILSARSRPWLRRLATRLIFSRPILRYGLRFFGSRSVLEDYHA